VAGEDFIKKVLHLEIIAIIATINRQYAENFILLKQYTKKSEKLVAKRTNRT
jgi:hypothetical protein